MVLEDFDTFNQNRFFTDILILTLSHFFIVVSFQAMPFGHFFEGPRLFDSRTMSNNEKKLLQQHFFPFHRSTIRTSRTKRKRNQTIITTRNR